MKRILNLLMFSFLLSACESDTVKTVQPIPRAETNVTAVGARSSGYGFYRETDSGNYDTFPSPEQFGKILTNQAALYPGSTPAALWIVGEIVDSSCSLEFPAPDDQQYRYIKFHDTDKHEPYLSHFDTIGVTVYLQVEAGMADMETLIDLVLSRYGHHPSVAGFGIDIEWYPSPLDHQGKPVGNPDEWGTTNEWAPISNAQVELFDEKIKAFNPSFQLFLKHWESEMCGTGPVSDVIYINDTQGYPSIDPLLREFTSWAKYYAPNAVGFQIGYGSDESWWNSMSDPLSEIGDAIISEIDSQEVQLYWVDFTLDHDLLSDLW